MPRAEMSYTVPGVRFGNTMRRACLEIPPLKLVAQYGDILAKEWFYAVGCKPPKGGKNGKNVEKLQAYLQRSAADLEFMGSQWPESYQRAELEIKKKAKTKVAHLSRTNLNAILNKAGVNEENYDGAARAMARIGAITHFPDSPDLGDFVVLKPQWLTKAISKVMEDGKLSDDKGEIEMKRMYQGGFRNQGRDAVQRVAHRKAHLRCYFSAARDDGLRV